MSLINEVNLITIVGGGTAGWLTAAYLTEKHKDITIRLIDKESSTPVGVGEGTLLSFNSIMQSCGFQPSDWFFEIDATLKSGILFPGWGQNNTDVWHPFMFQKTNIDQLDVSIIDLWAANQNNDFKTYGLSLYDISMNNKIDHVNVEFYAFHIDAVKLVKFLKNNITKRKNFELIESEVTTVNKDNNIITNLILENNNRINSDLYIDCTGFLKLLSKNDNIVDLKGRLFCDTALATHVPYNDKNKECHPYVISERVEHGWVWNIPVQTRIGSGLVFNRSLTSIEDAKEFFVDYWDNRIDTQSLKVLDWAPQYSSTPWNGNVISIGLSAGFIEPLESTGIALIIAGIEKLELILHNGYYTDTDIEFYNLTMAQDFEDAVDFVNMHYDQPPDSKFWTWVKQNYIESEKCKFFKNRIQNVKAVLPHNPTRHFFSANNWVCWLVQLGHIVNSNVNKNDADNLIKLFYTAEQDKKNKSPTHLEYIEFLKEQL